MEAKLRIWGRKNKKRVSIIGIVIIIVFTTFFFAVYKYGWDWTGFTSGYSKITITNTSQGATIAKEQSPAKSLWDWLGLLAALAIPIVVGFGAAWFTVQQGKVSDRKNRDNQQEAALQAYIDKMSDLLLDKNLRDAEPDDEKWSIARARTLTVLRGLDPRRRGNVILFLSDSKLISSIDLSGADLTEARLSLTHLESANLIMANLESAHLKHAHLEGANLKVANLSRADLSKAHLDGANLSGANLSGANLSGAVISEEQLKEARSLKDTTLPDGSKSKL